MNISDITDEMIQDHIDKIIDITLDIPINKLSILVGDNGAGKSLIRKQLPFRIAEKVGTDDMAHIVRSISMQSRTEARPEFGALSSIMHDSPWMPTSLSTYNLAEHLLTYHPEDKKFYVIDEPEIGMSQESQLGFALLLKKSLDLILESSYGLLIITHSHTFVEVFKDIAEFFYIGIGDENNYKTADEWLNREIVPSDFNFTDEWSSKLFRTIQDRINESKPMKGDW